MSTAPFNGQYNSFGIQNGMLPGAQEGPRCLPLNLDFRNAITAISLDMKIAQSVGHLSFVQTIYVDNSLNTKSFSVNAGTNGQIITVGPGCQGYIPILAINPPVLIASSNGGIVVPIQLLNFPVSPAVWNCNTPVFTFDGAGDLKVTDVALDALAGNWNGYGQSLATADLGVQSLISNIGGAGNALNVNVLTGGGGGGTVQDPPAQVQVNNGLSQATVFTPTAGKSFVCTSLQVVAEPFAHTTTAGEVTINIETGSTALWSATVWLPNAAPAPTVLTPEAVLIQLSGLAWKGAAVNDVLKVACSATINGSGGGIRVIASCYSV